jgi:hypothetical protein
MLKLLLSILLLLKASLVFAHVCPTLSEIQQGQLQGWQSLNASDDSPIPPEEAIAFFKEHGTHFWLAEWMPDIDLKGHCYYCIDEGCGMSDMYFAKDIENPPVGQNWRETSGDTKQCKSDKVDDCPF